MKRTRKSLRSFIAEHRADIDAQINAVTFRWNGNGGPGKIPNPPPTHNDQERREWVLNDEPLYRWAQAEGVAI